MNLPNTSFTSSTHPPKPSKHLAVLVDAIKAFSESCHETERVLPLIARRTSEALNAFCSFSLEMEDRDWSRTVAWHGPDPEMNDRLARIAGPETHRRDRPLVLQMEVERRTHVLLSPVPLEALRARAPRSSDDELLALEVESVLLVSMRARSETVGWLTLVRCGRGSTPFDQADIELARSLADHAALGLVSARLLAQRERDIVRRAALSEVARSFAAATGDEGKLVEVIARRVGEIFDGLCVVRRETASSEPLVAQGVFHPDPCIAELAQRVSVVPITRGQGITGTVFASGKPVIIHDFDRAAAAVRDGPFGAFVEAANITSTMFVPLTTQERTVGVIAVGASGGRRHTAEDLALLQDLAAHASVALMNSQLLAESRRAEEVLRRGYLDAAPDAVLIANADGKIVMVNRQGETLFGYTRTELVGMSIDALVPERLRTGHAHQRMGYHTAPTTRPMGASLDLFARRKDGSEFAAEIMLSPIETEGGVLVAAAIRDVTERRREMDERNQRMAASNRLKSEFLANMSHELRTPLNAIIGFTSLMHSGRTGALSETHREYLGDVLTSARHLLQLINDILDLAKVESGQMELRYELVDLEVVTQEVRDILRGLTVGRGVKLEIAIDPDLGLVEVDPRMLKQVLYNYLSNAIKFSREHTNIRIRMTPAGDNELRIDVEDAGIGIATEDLHRLFIEFQQLEAAATKRHQGTGLGLALVKRIVEAHGGRVGVESVLGEGSTFTAIFPRRRPSASQS